MNQLSFNLPGFKEPIIIQALNSEGQSVGPKYNQLISKGRKILQIKSKSHSAHQYPERSYQIIQ